MSVIAPLNGSAATLVWDPNSEPDVVGYRVYLSEETAQSVVDVGPATRFPIPTFPGGSTVLFNVTAYNSSGLESDFSATVTHVVPLTLSVAWPASPVGGVVSNRLYFGELNQLARSTNVGARLAAEVPVTRGASYFVYAEAVNTLGQVVDSYTQQVCSVPLSGAVPQLVLTRQNIAPVVGLTSPAPGTTLAAGAVTTLTAAVSDADGTVVRTDFFAGSVKLGSATSAPFTFRWTPSTAGAVQLSAVAVDNSGGSTRSANLGVSVVISKPAAPALPVADVLSSSSIRLSWADRAVNETGYYIYRALGAGAFARVATNAASLLMLTNHGLLPASTYHFRVAAFNSAGESAWVAVSATTLIAPPTAPAGLASSASATNVVLTWTDSSTSETEYRVYRSSAGGAFQQIATLPAGATSHTDSAVSPGTACVYRVAAWNAGGESVPAQVSTTIPLPAPEAPASLRAVAQWTPEIRLSWVENATNEAGFRVYVSVNAGPFQLVSTLPANSTAYVHTLLLKATRYDYRVVSFNSGGESAAALAGARTL